MTKPMTLETTEKLALLADALWSAFMADATLDGADLQYILEQSGLTEWTPATAADAAAGECDVPGEFFRRPVRWVMARGPDLLLARRLVGMKVKPSAQCVIEIAGHPASQDALPGR
jgi:hypothetical protein